ncbi:alpha/beta hydrolase [Pseudoxanthomonas sp. 10H]|uniref:hypothetical protein n=1 Tax=Pseudoxanthomonas sp. 10H TaxID=3242729 RepID=UPI0035590D6B
MWKLPALVSVVLALGAMPEASGQDGPKIEVLDALSPLATSQQLTARLLTPLMQDKIARFRAASGVELKEQSLGAGREKVRVWVPDHPPGERLGILVFMWPAEGIEPPPDWWRMLREQRLVYVAPMETGNTENVFDRRVPLALHAYEYARSRFDIDEARVFIGGFSGGSRVAQRVALAYPDVFRGVMLVGGSDPIGTAGFTPPEASLMSLFQTRSRIVYATGDRDLPNRAKDERTRRSFEALCVAGVVQVSQPRLDHWVPDGRGLRKALVALQSPSLAEATEGACRQGLAQRVEQELAGVESLVAQGRAEDARARLVAIDAMYGGLAAPRSVELARRLEGPVTP